MLRYFAYLDPVDNDEGSALLDFKDGFGDWLGMLLNQRMPHHFSTLILDLRCLCFASTLECCRCQYPVQPDLVLEHHQQIPDSKPTPTEACSLHDEPQT